jgi:site-specific recombinase XerD
MTIKFFLNPPPKGRATCLILLKTWDIPSESGKPTVFSINEKISKKDWDATKGRALKSYPQATWLNAILSKYETKALDFIRQHQVDKDCPPSSEALKAHLTTYKAQLTGKAATTSNAVTFESQWQKTIDELKKKKTDTWRHYASTLKQIKVFAKEKRLSLAFEAMNAEWFQLYQDWLFEQGDNTNTVTAKWKRLKRVLNIEGDDNPYQSKDHRRRSLALSFQKADEIYLTNSELMALYNLDLSHTTLEKTRDTFLLDSFAAGFRFGDLSGLGEGKIINLNDRQALKLHTGKTDTAVITPNSWFLDEFLQKYKGNFPKRLTNQVYNRNIKKLCMMAGINQPTTLRKNIAGKNTEVTRPKYMWATQYTGRYSFATNLKLSGVDIKFISILLGHKKVATTETYIKANELDTAMAMSSIAFFTTKPEQLTAAAK